ncbi:MAG: PrpR N-terminal domain-containing protein [Coprococcus sp.]
MKDTIRVLAIAPYEGLAHLLKLIGNQYDMLHLDIFVGDLEQGLTIARSHLPGRYDAVISRGGTADRIRCITPLPVIDISFSVYDILRSLKLAENYAQNYAFVGFQSIIDTVHILCDLLQYRIETHVVNSEEEIAPTLEQLKKQGITLVFGDT